MSDNFTLGPAGSELDLSDKSKHYVRRNGYRVIRDSDTGKATAIELDVWCTGTSTDDTEANIAAVKAKLVDAEMAFGAASAGAPGRLGRRLGTSLERRYWIFKRGVMQEQEQIDPDSQERPHLVTLTLGDSGQYGDSVALTVTGTLTNGAAVVVLDDIDTEDPAPIALTLTAVSGTPQGYRVGIQQVPAGTAASDFDHVVDLGTASGATNNATTSADVGSNVKSRAITTGTAWDDIGTASQPAGSQNQGKRHVYVRGYDTPGTPSLAAPSGLTADDVGPVLSGGQTNENITYSTPVMASGRPEIGSNTGSGVGSSINVAATWNPITVAGNLWIAVVFYKNTKVTPGSETAITSISVPSGWRLLSRYEYKDLGSTPSVTWTVGIYCRVNAPASTAAQTWTFNHGSTAGSTRSTALWMADYSGASDVVALPISAIGSGAITLADGLAKTFTTGNAQRQPNELALAVTHDHVTDDGGVAEWLDTWESLYASVFDIGQRVSEAVGSLQATMLGDFTEASAGALLASIMGEAVDASSTINQDRVDSGNFRAGTYGLRAQWVDASGNISTPTSTVNVVVASDGSRIDGSLTPQAGAVHYLLSISRPQGGFRQVVISDTTFSLTDDDAGRTLTALPTTATVTSVPSNNRLMVGTVAEQGAAGRRFSLPTTSMHTVRAGTYDLPPVPATSDGTRPNWGLHTEAQSGSAGVSATVRHDALFIFPTDAFVTMYAKGTARSTFIYELRPDGVIAARTEGSGNVGQVVAPSELHVWKGSNVLVIEALGTKNASIEDCFASNLALTFTAQVTYTPRYRG